MGWLDIGDCQLFLQHIWIVSLHSSSLFLSVANRIKIELGESHSKDKNNIILVFSSVSNGRLFFIIKVGSTCFNTKQKNSWIHLVSLGEIHLLGGTNTFFKKYLLVYIKCFKHMLFYFFSEKLTHRWPPYVENSTIFLFLNHAYQGVLYFCQAQPKLNFNQINPLKV